MLNWDDVRIFLAVAEQGTISAASGTLRINHTTVSRRISSLEASQGVKLFNRANSGFTLTAAGQALADKSDAIRDVMGQAERALAGGATTVKGPLTVTAPSALVLHVIGPMMQQFSMHNPDIELRLLSNDRIASLPRREADIAIRATDAPDDFLIGRRLTALYSTWYATPALLKQYTNAPLPWVATDAPQSRSLEHKRGPQLQTSPSSLVSGKAEAMVLAEAGVGAAHLPIRLGDASPLLQIAPGSTKAKGQDIWLLYHRDLSNNPRVRRFSDFAFEQFQKERLLFEGQHF